MTEAYPYTERDIGNMFDRIAPRYDFLNRLLSARQDERWRRTLARNLPYRPGGVLIDVATGTGDVIRQAAETRPELAEIVGVDISQEMLNLAQTKTAGITQPRITLRKASAESLPVTSQSADALTISFGLRNVIDKVRAIREFHRVLKPGGSLLILEFFLPEKGLLAGGFQFYFHNVLPLIGGLFADKSAYSYLPKSVGTFYPADGLRQVLYEQGFTVEREKKFLFGACRLFVAKRL